MGDIIYLPGCRPDQLQPEPEFSETNEIDDDEYWKATYAPVEDYIYPQNKCFKCSHEFEEEEQIWYINQEGNYPSKLDQSHVNIKFCDTCLCDFLEIDKKISEK